jgi:hypothetical protein
MKRGTTAGSYTVRAARVTYALPASTTAVGKQPKEPSKTNRSKGIIVDPVRLATCLDRSVAASGAIASTVSPCLPWRKLLSPGRSACRWSSGPSVGRVSGPERSGGPPGASSGPRGRPLGRVGRPRPAVAALRARGQGGRATRPSWKTIGAWPGSAPSWGLGGPRAGLAGAGRGGRWIWFGGARRILRWPPATTDTRVLGLWSKPNRL